MIKKVGENITMKMDKRLILSCLACLGLTHCAQPPVVSIDEAITPEILPTQEFRARLQGFSTLSSDFPYALSEGVVNESVDMSTFKYAYAY
ncbi:MAG: hypothetical protein AAF512_23170, partial [Pseudomonadota bacterium]